MKIDEYLNKILENSPMFYHDIYEILKNPSNVFEIFKTDAAWDSGDYRWVVSWPDGDDDYWINSFFTLDSAVEFCEELDLKWRIIDEKS